MTQTPIWRAIAATLTEEIARGHWPRGTRLPTEARLAERFGVNRHTVRHALSTLAANGLVWSRRGKGVFVAEPPPADYTLGPRVRFGAQIAAAGRMPSRRFLSLETRAGEAAETAALDLPPRARVHCAEGIGYADDVPLAVFRAAFPADRLPDLPQHLRATGSVTAALAACGVDDYTRASTRLSAVAADPIQAGHLQVPEGAPLLRAVSVNVDTAGRPCEYGHTYFAGNRATLVTDSGGP